MICRVGFILKRAFTVVKLDTKLQPVRSSLL